MFVPQILRFLDGHREVRPVLGLQVGDEEYQFCRQLMIETALHLAEMDFDLDPYGLFMAAIPAGADRGPGGAPAAKRGRTDLGGGEEVGGRSWPARWPSRRRRGGYHRG
jgi:hypothetical protein